MKYFLAIDLGATSGRHIISYEENNEIILKEIYRFPTGMDDSINDKVWDIPRIFNHIKEGIKIAFKEYKEIESLSIDTWGVDYVLMNEDKEITPYYAYRNKRNIIASEEVHKIVPFKEIYNRTGIQFAAFNTIYQLYSDLKEGRLDNATDYLTLPSYFSYKLTGVKSHEYTMDSTGALLNINTLSWDYELIDKLGLPRKLFTEISLPGTVLGYFTKEMEEELGGNTKVILCASHDTGSAFEAVDVDDKSVIISSGTWSLLGIKANKPIVSEKGYLANYTNEGGVNYIRFLKNIMGMWIVNEFRREENIQTDFSILLEQLKTNDYKEIFDVNDPSLNAPHNMKEAIVALLEKSKKHLPTNDLDMFNAIYHSMANSYNIAICELKNITNIDFNKVVVIGGGAKNYYLNNLIEKYTGLKVLAYPIEATALGNIKIQMKVSKK